MFYEQDLEPEFEYRGSSYDTLLGRALIATDAERPKNLYKKQLKEELKQRLNTQLTTKKERSRIRNNMINEINMILTNVNPSVLNRMYILAKTSQYKKK
jgi:hypothetical protein